MPIRLSHTASQYVVHNEAGYHFAIETAFTELDGWNATARITSEGLKVERAAISRLREPLRQLLKELDEEFGSSED